MRSRVLPLLVLSLLAFKAWADAEAQGPDPSKLVRVESVVVAGLTQDTAREIVAAQSLLVPGREYSEEEIRLAVYRVQRLPFVLDAEYSLRAGDAGSTEVLITVTPNRPFFALAEVSGIRDGDAEAGEDGTDGAASATVRGRLFVGPRGLLSGQVEGFDGVGPAFAEARFTQYGLFGRGASARVALRTDVNRDDSDFFDASLVVDLPLDMAQTLRADATWFQSNRENGDFQARNESRALGLAWIYDTTDDPLFATRGTHLAGGARYSRSEQRFRSSDFPFEDSSDSWGLDLSARRYWALTGRQSVNGEVTGSWSRSTIGEIDDDREISSAALRVGHSLDLLRWGRGARRADLRWESSVQVLASRAESDFGRDTSTDGRLTTGLALRNDWGLLRLSFAYVENLDRDFRPGDPSS